MEIDEIAILDDKGFIEVKGEEAKDFLQNLVTNDIEKVTNSLTIFSSILTPQGKYLYDFFILKLKNGYLLECEKESTLAIIKLLQFYKLRSNIDLIDVSKQFRCLAISSDKFKKISKTETCKGYTINYEDEPIYVDPRNEKLGAKLIVAAKNASSKINKLGLKVSQKEKYYAKSFELGIPQIHLNKLKEKIFGMENNLDELNGIDFKKGCYVGQENTSRIKLRNKLRKRILPVKIISGEVLENDIIKYNNIEIGRIMIDKPYPFALIKVVDPNLEEFANIELICEKSKIKILKPDWI